MTPVAGLPGAILELEAGAVVQPHHLFRVQPSRRRRRSPKRNRAPRRFSSAEVPWVWLTCR